MVSSQWQVYNISPAYLWFVSAVRRNRIARTTNGNSSSLRPHKRQRESSSSIDSSEPSSQHTSLPQAPSSSTSLSDANSRPNEMKNDDEQCLSKAVSKAPCDKEIEFGRSAHQYIVYSPADGENKFEKIVVDVSHKQTFSQEVSDNGCGCLSNCFKRFLFADLEGFHLRYLPFPKQIAIRGSLGFSAGADKSPSSNPDTQLLSGYCTSWVFPPARSAKQNEMRCL
jgi:hypothetical protein